MSLLGHGDLLHRAAAVLGGWLRPGLPSAAASAPCRVIGHRGAARFEAENTIPAFRRALELGADAVEADVSVTGDGRFALWHDADPNDHIALAREAGVEELAYRPKLPAAGSRWRRPVRELSAEELQRHFGYEPSEPAASGGRVGIDWLEGLHSWASRAGVRDVYLDVKLADDQTGAAAALVAWLRQRGGATAGSTTVYHLLSPRGPIVRSLADACGDREAPRLLDDGDAPRLRVSADLELPAPKVSELSGTGARDVSLGAGGRAWPGYRHDVGRMLRARDAGVFGSVVCWTLNERPRLEMLVAAGVDGVLTDEPALLREIVAAAGRAAPRA
jgi:glycerophosphoryl diester phosphodiesterase